MASQADTKADAAAEKAYAEAAEQVSTKKPSEAPAEAEAAPKIDTAVAAEKAKSAAPKKAPAPKGKAKPARRAAAKPKAKPVVKAKKPAAKRPVSKIKTATTKPTISELKDKIMATAKNTDFTKTLKDAAGELQARAKSAYEKSQAYAGEMTEFSKGNFEALVESGKILSSGMQDMARGEVEAAKGAFETATADLKAMAAVKTPTELFKLQGEIARRNFDAAVAHYSKNAEAGMKLANDAFAPISSRMSLAAEKVSKAA